jgi:hypothetical protein
MMFKRAVLPFVLALSVVLLASAPALAAEGPAPGGLAPSPGQLEFGPVDMHSSGSAHQSVQFSSESELPLVVLSTTITGADASSFQIVGDGCSGKILAFTESCSVEVAYQPGAHAAQSASLELLDDQGIVVVALSGAGITGTLSANPNPLSFAPIPYTPPGSFEGEYNETEQVTVSDSQDAATQIDSVSITGPDASSFSIQWGNCEHNLLGPNSWCSMGVRFAPDSPGPKQASLVLDSDSATPLVVPLQAEALHGPKMSVDSEQVLLGEVPIGSSTQHTITVSNSGDYPLVIQQAFRISGTPLMFPVRSDTCSRQMVLPSASCALTVGFEPTTLGEKGASVLFITNASPITVVGIDGVGVGVRSLVSTPKLSSTLTPAAGGPPAAGAPPAAAAGSRERAKAAAASPPALAVKGAPRLYGPISRAALDTGLVAQCPAQLPGCETVSLVKASVPLRASRAPARRVKSTAVLLGSALSVLHGGQSASVRVPLTGHALALLKQRGRLRVTIKTLVRVGGRVVAQRTRVATLRAPGAPARHP